MELRINDTMIYWESLGRGTPCLCPHGGPGTDSRGLRVLEPIARELGLQLILWDHRGHGRSNWDPVERCTQDQLVKDMDAIRAALGFVKVLVLGISWGGFLSLMYSARYPERVMKLVTVGAAASHEFMARAEENARILATPEQYQAYRSLWDGSLASDEEMARAFATIRPLYFYNKELAERANQVRSGTRYRVAVRNFVIHHEYKNWDCRPELANIRCPTLVCVGRHDWICPVDQSEEIHRLIPGSRLVIFERSGHSPHIEEPEAFTEELRKFLWED